MSRIAPEVSILIVGFNSGSHLPACLKSINYAAQEHSFEVVYIDNGADDSSMIVQQAFPAAKIVPRRGNIGFARANNLLSQSASGRLLLLLNPDTQLFSGAIDELINAAQVDSRYGILGGATFLDKTRSLPMPMIELPNASSIVRGFWPRHSHPSGQNAAGEIQEVSAVSGGFMLVRREVWDQLDGFDERFFLYGEDLDLCHRARKRGWKVGFVADAAIFHDIGSGETHSKQRQLLQARGTATYHRKHFPKQLALTNLILMWLNFVVRAIGATALSPFSRRFAAMARALIPLAVKPWAWIRGY